MLTLLLLLGSLVGGRASRLTDLPSDSAFAVDSSRLGPDSKWTYAFPQFLAGVGGTALGGLGGAAAGGIFGFFVWMGNGSKYQSECNTVCTPDAGTEIETGARIGAFVGGVMVGTRLVLRASPKAFPSKNPGGAFAGALAGGGAAWIATRSMVETDGGYTWPRWGLLALSSSLGSVLADRVLASSTPVTVTPWAPTPGTNGAKVSLGF